MTISFKVFSQSDLTLYDMMNNPITHNPAYAGVTDSYFFKLSHSSQWVGFEGAPKTQILDFQKKFENQKNALGVSIINDEFGAIRNTNIELNYAFHTNVSYSTELILGLKAGYNDLSVDYSLLNIYDPTESIYQQNNISEPLPLIGAGLYISNQEFWFATSVSNFIQKKIEDEDSEHIFRKRSHGYFNFGYLFYLSDSFDLRTQFLGQIVRGGPVDIIYNAEIEFEQKFSFSININPSSHAGIGMGFNFAGNGRIGYGYNLGVRDIGVYSNGNHFISFSYFIEGYRRGSFSNYRGYKNGKMFSRRPYMMR